MRFLPMIERSNARIARTRSLCVSTVPLASRQADSSAIFRALPLRSLFGEKRICSFLCRSWSHQASTIPDVHHQKFPLDLFVFEWTHFVMTIDEDLPLARRACGTNTTCAPLCPCVLEASAIRPVERSLRFKIENMRSMELNHRGYRAMKSGSTFRQNRQKLERNGTGQMPCCFMEAWRETSGKKPSMI